MKDLKFNRPSEEILRDLLYVGNGIRLDPSGIRVGIPKALDLRPDIDSDENTFIELHVDPDLDQRFAGHNGLLYRRVTLAEVPFPEPPPSTIRVPAYPFKTSDILEEINRYFGTQLTVNDIVDRVYLEDGDPLILTIHPDSLVYQGHISLAETLFGFVLPVTMLSGFTEYAAATP